MRRSAGHVRRGVSRGDRGDQRRDLPRRGHGDPLKVWRVPDVTPRPSSEIAAMCVPASVGLVDGLQRDGLAGVLALMLFSARGLASASPGQVDTWLSHALAPALAAFFL